MEEILKVACDLLNDGMWATLSDPWSFLATRISRLITELGDF